MIIKRTIEIDYGHCLPNHYSFCNQIHGHRGVITAHVEGDVSKEKGDSSEGMVIDFKIIKELMIKKIHDVLDHGFAIWKDDNDCISQFTPSQISTRDFIESRNEKVLITDEPPTAECLAKWAFNQIAEDLLKKRSQVASN